MRIRQVALASSDLMMADETLCRLLGCAEGYIDREIIYFGLQNRLYTVGDSFLEVVSPAQPGAAAGRFLERRGTDGGYMVIVQVEDLEREKKRLEHTGIRTVFSDDRGVAKAIHLHPKDVPGAIPSLDEMTPPESWLWAGDGWEARAARHVSDIKAVEIASDSPRETGNCWAKAYGKALQQDGKHWCLSLGNTEIRFVLDSKSNEPALRAIDFDTLDFRAICAVADELGLSRRDRVVSVCGVDFNFC